MLDITVNLAYSFARTIRSASHATERLLKRICAAAEWYPRKAKMVFPRHILGHKMEVVAGILTISCTEAHLFPASGPREIIDSFGVGAHQKAGGSKSSRLGRRAGASGLGA
jgi:hypothetical protein